MPNTSGGTPYVSASDLVAAYPTVSLNLANKVDTKMDYALPVNAQTGTSYTFALADGLRLTSASNASPVTLTIPPQSSVVWPANTIIRVVNYGAGVTTIAGGAGVTVTNATTTLARFQSAALIRTASDSWTLVPFSGGANKALVSATTGSPTVTTYTSGNESYDIYSFLSTGTITFNHTGLGRVEVLVVSGGGGGSGNTSGSGGGGGGGLFYSSLNIPSGAFTATVGAGGAKAAGGGAVVGANGSQGSFGLTASGLPVSWVPGAFGGNGTTGGGGGGQGATVWGAQGGVFNATPAGAAGRANDYRTGSVQTYAGGGGAGFSGGAAGAAGGAGGGGRGAQDSDGGTTNAACNGTANSGGGGGGASGFGTNAGNGGSGIVIVRVLK